MICPRCGSELVEVDNPMRPEHRHRRGTACDTFEPPSNLDRLDWGTRNLSDCGRPDCIYCAEVPITHDVERLRNLAEDLAYKKEIAWMMADYKADQ